MTRNGAGHRGWLAGLALLALACAPARAAPGPASTASAPAISAGQPDGFDILLLPQTTLVDVYYGGRRVGSAMARYSPGVIHFLQPAAVLALIPNLSHSPALLTAMDGDLPTHAERACTDETNGKCRRLEPETIGVVFDQATFRADLFVNPALLGAAAIAAGRYLPAATAGPSLAGSLGGQLSGSARAGADYDVQAHLIAAYGTARLLANISQSSTLGTRIDAMAASVDHGALRAQAGLLSSPTLSLIDQGHFYGVSLGSQTDTLANRDQIAANPIPIYLPNRAQVDILRNGRLISSHPYGAGNQLIDTTGLPEGSYIVTLRIREAGGYVHEETRSITKNSALPPMGIPQFFIGAGVTALETTSGVPQAGRPFAQAGYARRLSSGTAVDASVALMDNHPLLDLGVDYATARGLRLRGATLMSSGNGYGVMLTAAMNLGPSSVISLDARQGWGSDNHAWTTQQVAAAVSSGQAITAIAPALNGSQITAAYSAGWHGAQLGVIGAYHQAPFAKVSYAYGPNVDIPIHLAGHAAGTSLRLMANATQTEHGLQAYVGFRLLLNRGRASLSSDAGLSSMSSGGARQTGAAADVTAALNVADPRLGDVNGSVGFTHAPGEDTAVASGQLRGRNGDFTLQVAHDFTGAPGTAQPADTRYAAGFVIGAALTPTHVAVGDPAGGDSGVMVRVDAPAGSDFEVLINNAPRGIVRAGQTLPVMLPAYRVYAIRLAPMSASVLDFDAGARTVTLYPGNVQAMVWKAQKIVEVFGRALDMRGNPVAEAAILGGRTPGLTDENGYFQLEMTADGKLQFQTPGLGSGARLCEIMITGVKAAATHLSIGTRQCRAVMFADQPEQVHPEVASAGGTAGATSIPWKPRPTAYVLARPAVGELLSRALGARTLGDSGPRGLESQPAHPRHLARPGRAGGRGAVQLRYRAALRGGGAHRGAGPRQERRT